MESLEIHSKGKNVEFEGMRHEMGNLYCLDAIEIFT